MSLFVIWNFLESYINEIIHFVYCCLPCSLSVLILVFISVIHPLSLLSGMSLCGHTTVCLSFTSWKIILRFWLLQVKLLWKSMYKSLCGHMPLFVLGKYPRVVWVDHMVCIYLISQETAKVLVLFYNPTSSLQMFRFLCTLTDTWYGQIFLILAILVVVQCVKRYTETY